MRGGRLTKVCIEAVIRLNIEHVVPYCGCEVEKSVGCAGAEEER